MYDTENYKYVNGIREIVEIDEHLKSHIMIINLFYQTVKVT